MIAWHTKPAEELQNRTKMTVRWLTHLYRMNVNDTLPEAAACIIRQENETNEEWKRREHSFDFSIRFMESQENMREAMEDEEEYRAEQELRAYARKYI